MRPFLRLLALVLTVLLPAGLLAQESLSETNAEKLRTLAQDRVKKYTSYLKLIANAEPEDRDEVEGFRNNLYQLVDNPEMVIFQDLFPEKLRANARTIDLKTYLTDFGTYYTGKLVLDYQDYQVSPVYYDRSQKRYFVKVTVLRGIQGRFRNQGTLSAHVSSERLDFYLSASVVNQKASLNRIYSVDEHRENGAQFTEVKVVNPPPISFEGMSALYKRGKVYAVNWRGGFKGEIVKVGLYRIGKDASVSAIDSSLYNGDNNFTFPMQLQTKVRPGSYQLMIDNTNNLKPPIPSGAFIVKRKIPLVAKIAIGAVVATGGYFGIKYLIDKNHTSAEDPLPFPKFGLPATDQ
jgi:hypothetical protein